ncbi:transcriptional regulator [Chelonobacter oris]|uniref:Transcriptional regulator n=1 Tax=Chelonobacter oris TaxID=505317 RepID=A0A0A3AT82_9PAST|nr:HTH-type transcriptional activator IlvY [Chelonobacter oris]KGQ70275.1 transcriptional regulator [Chelonobacter oris]
MNFQEIKLFLDLAENRNFHQTAVQNHMSPSTLSRQIQKMEAELKQSLFLRDNRQVSLTKTGEKFLLFARQNWQQWQQFKQALNTGQTELQGELKLFCSVTAAYSHLPPILERFRRHYPQVEIKLTTGDPANAIEQVRSQQADLALVGKPLKLPDNIDFHFIAHIQLSLITPRVACTSTRLLQQHPPDWQQIPFILPVAGPVRERIDLWFKQMNIKHPKIYASVSGHEGIVPMVALGCGVALLPDIVIKNSPMNGQVSYLDLPLSVKPFELGVCVQKKRLQLPLIDAFWHILQPN